MSWKDEIGGGFSYQTADFGVRPLDNGRAFDLLTKMRKEDAIWSEVETAVRDYLKKNSVTDEKFINEQLVRVEAYYRPWLRY